MSHAGGSWAVRAVWLQGSLEPGETLPLKLKWILRREFWPQFQNLLKQGTEVGAHRAPGALRVLVMALLMQQSFPVHRYTRGTSMTPATQITPGLRPLPSVCTLTIRTMWR